MNNELHGTLVMVHPDLQNDPYEKQGQVGIVTYVDDKSDIYVSFNHKAEGVYTPSALFQLKERKELFANTHDSFGSMRVDDYKDLFKISQLQDMGRGKDLWHALEIARDNPAIWPKSLSLVEEGMAISQHQQLER